MRKSDCNDQRSPAGARLRPSTWLVGVAGLTCLSLLAGTKPAAAIPYSFTLVAETGDTYASFIQFPSINNAGEVAFGAKLTQGGAGVFRAADGSTATIANTQTSPQFGGFEDSSINDSGMVAFGAEDPTLAGLGIFSGNGGPLTTIVSSPPVFGVPSINNAGQVSFAANGSRILLGDGISLLTLADTSADFRTFGDYAPLNNKGQVAFLGANSQGLPTGGTIGIFLADSSGFTEIFNNSNAVNGGAGFADQRLVINNKGQVGFFYWAPPSQSSAHGIFLTDGNQTQLVVGEGAAFPKILPNFSLNDSGSVAFTASTLDGSWEGLYLGPDPINDLLIATGDLLDGKRITSFLFGREGLNNGGRVTFEAGFDDGSYAIYIARRGLPEPSTVSLITVALLGAGFAACMRRRKQSTGHRWTGALGARAT